jgi:hypothetical protein
VQVDVRLDDVVIKAMQQQPERRYQQVSEMKTDVDRIRTSPMQKSEVGSQKSEGKTSRIAAIIAACLALAGAGGYFIWEKMNASRASRTQAEPGSAESSPTLQRAEPSPASGRPDGLKPPTTLPAATTTTASATTDAPFVNTLGMKFVPVPITGGPTGGQRVLFSVWDTRVRDYEIFVKETKREWPKADVVQGTNHPAVNVSWEDATTFTKWLTERERAAGSLAREEEYRLPTDYEWSCAAGIGDRENAAISPAAKKPSIKDEFPWGTLWPPPKDAGNFAGEEMHGLAQVKFANSVRVTIPEYNDGFVTTSPVGSFAANRFGIYDMAGNVAQWCDDWFDDKRELHILRGSSWAHGSSPSLLSSVRHRPVAENGGNRMYGFRCVLAPTAP